MATSDKDIGNKKWNSEQEKQKGEINEGFSGKNLPADYNPSKGKLKTEIEKDAKGNTDVVKRARPSKETKTDENLKNKKNPENRDKNSDIDPNRYPSSHPDNKKNRGNIK
ncbi:hypothetical protein ABH942_002899 [Flavobacterium sp. 28YEA47A]|uniref:hypothetical protein n=1 Tax=Flavobacterium sp. 28YEA47A TaxID=3156276 RepID=UPI0035144B06